MTTRAILAVAAVWVCLGNYAQAKWDTHTISDPDGQPAVVYWWADENPLPADVTFSVIVVQDTSGPTADSHRFDHNEPGLGLLSLQLQGYSLDFANGPLSMVLAYSGVDPYALPSEHAQLWLGPYPHTFSSGSGQQSFVPQQVCICCANDNYAPTGDPPGLCIGETTEYYCDDCDSCGSIMDCECEWTCECCDILPTCASGGCPGCPSTPLDCNDNDACTEDYCINDECVSTPMSCPPCEECVNGACTGGCADSTECKYVVCNVSTNECEETDTCTGCSHCEGDECVSGCDDSNLCSPEVCEDNQCVPDPVLCESTACINRECNPTTGNCDIEYVDCSDDNECTADSCDDNTGCHHTMITCDDPECHHTWCDAVEGCKSVPTCNDSNLVCITNVCQDDTCVLVETVCDDPDESDCILNECVEAEGGCTLIDYCPAYNNGCRAQCCVNAACREHDLAHPCDATSQCVDGEAGEIATVEFEVCNNACDEAHSAEYDWEAEALCSGFVISNPQGTVSVPQGACSPVYVYVLVQEEISPDAVGHISLSLEDHIEGDCATTTQACSATGIILASGGTGGAAGAVVGASVIISEDLWEPHIHHLDVNLASNKRHEYESANGLEEGQQVLKQSVPAGAIPPPNPLRSGRRHPESDEYITGRWHSADDYPHRIPIHVPFAFDSYEIVGQVGTGFLRPMDTTFFQDERDAWNAAWNAISKFQDIQSPYTTSRVKEYWIDVTNIPDTDPELDEYYITPELLGGNYTLRFYQNGEPDPITMSFSVTDSDSVLVVHKSRPRNEWGILNHRLYTLSSTDRRATWGETINIEFKAPVSGEYTVRVSGNSGDSVRVFDDWNAHGPEITEAGPAQSFALNANQAKRLSVRAYRADTESVVRVALFNKDQCASAHALTFDVRPLPMTPAADDRLVLRKHVAGADVVGYEMQLPTGGGLTDSFMVGRTDPSTSCVVEGHAVGWKLEDSGSTGRVESSGEGPLVYEGPWATGKELAYDVKTLDGRVIVDYQYAAGGPPEQPLIVTSATWYDLGERGDVPTLITNYEYSSDRLVRTVTTAESYPEVPRTEERIYLYGECAGSIVSGCAEDECTYITPAPLVARDLRGRVIAVVPALPRDALDPSMLGEPDPNESVSERFTYLTYERCGLASFNDHCDDRLDRHGRKNASGNMILFQKREYHPLEGGPHNAIVRLGVAHNTDTGSLGEDWLEQRLSIEHYDEHQRLIGQEECANTWPASSSPMSCDYVSTQGWSSTLANSEIIAESWTTISPSGASESVGWTLVGEPYVAGSTRLTTVERHGEQVQTTEHTFDGSYGGYLKTQDIHKHNQESELVTGYEYHSGTGLLHKVIRPTEPGGSATAPIVNATTTYSYNDAGRLHEVTEPSASSVLLATQYDYDRRGNRTRTTSIVPATEGLSQHTTFAFDSFGALLSTLVQNAGGSGAHLTTRHIRDPRNGRLAATQVHEGTPDDEFFANLSEQTYLYHEVSGAVIQRKDALDTAPFRPGGPDDWATTDMQYDATGTWLLGESSPAATTTYAYNHQGDIVTRDDSGVVTTFEYEGRGLVKSQERANLLTEMYYDGSGRLLATVDPRGISERYLYDGSDRVSTRYECGLLAGDPPVAPGPPTAAECPNPDAAISTEYEYDLSDHVTREARSDVSEVRTEYDDYGRPWRIRYLVSADGLESDIEDLAGRTFADKVQIIEYNSAGLEYRRIVKGASNAEPSFESGDEYTTYDYNTLGNVLRIENSWGHTESFTYDDASHQRVTHVSDPDVLNEETSYERDVLGRITRTTEPEYADITVHPPEPPAPLVAHYSEQEYDSRGNLYRTIRYDGSSDAIVHQELFLYGPDGRLACQAERFGAQPLLDPDNTTDHVQRYTYTELGQLDTATRYNSNSGTELVTEYEYDPYGRLVWTKPPDGSLHGRSIDQNTGELLYEVRQDARGAAFVDYYYDEFGRTRETRLTSSTGSDYLAQAYAHDDAHRVASVQNPKQIAEGANHKTSFEYDLIGNLVAQVEDTNGLSRRTEWIHDRIGRKRIACAFLGNTVQETKYDFVPAKNCIDVTYPGQNAIRFILDSKGQVRQRVDADSIATWYTRDPRGRLVKTLDLGGLAAAIERAYDATGRPVKVTRSAGSSTSKVDYLYDDANKTVLETQTHPGGLSFNLLRTLDQSGNRIQLSSPTAPIDIQYGFDRMGRNDSITSGDISIEYDLAGQQVLSRTTTKGGSSPNPLTLVSTTGLDEFFRPVEFTTTSQSTVLSLAHMTECDPNGNPLSRTRQLGEATSPVLQEYRTSTFDDLDRLTQSAAGSVIEDYPRDLLNNPIELTTTSSECGDVDVDPDAPTIRNELPGIQFGSAASYGQDHSLNGSVTRQFDTATPSDALTFDYDMNERLISIKDGSQLIEEYVYDGLGRRISRSSYDADGSGPTVTHYFYDGQNEICETDDQGNVTRSYLHGSHYIDERIAVTNTEQTCFNGACDETSFYLTYDQFTIAGLVDDAGQIQEAYEYDDRGNVRVYVRHDGAPDPNPPGSCPFVDGFDLQLDSPRNPYFFMGRRMDCVQTDLTEADFAGIRQLYDFRARTYDPAQGRFMQRDPKGYVDGMNLYDAFGSNPMRKLDPMGTDSFLRSGGFSALRQKIAEAKDPPNTTYVGDVVAPYWDNTVNSFEGFLGITGLGDYPVDHHVFWTDIEKRAVSTVVDVDQYPTRELYLGRFDSEIEHSVLGVQLRLAAGNSSYEIALSMSNPALAAHLETERGNLTHLGSVQGFAGSVNGAQDIAVETINLGLYVLGSDARLQLPDWSRDLFFPISDEAHAATKVLGGEGAVFLATAGWSGARAPSRIAASEYSNIRTAARFLKDGAPYFDGTELRALTRSQRRGIISGLDLSRPVTVRTLDKGTELIQYVREGGRPGPWFTTSGTPASVIGLYSGGRQMTRFRTTLPTRVMESTARPIFDTWSVRGFSVPTSGGGTQFYTFQGYKVWPQ